MTSDDPYHMRRPDLAEAKAALEKLYGHTAAEIWQRLLTQSGLTGKETDPDAVRRLADTMVASDPVLALSGRALMIRVKSYEYLQAAASAVADAR
ncbi:hypothetical protein [Winogradskya humida]|uniref:Uncharacterized protein n=1 Tax=Winogradskya humida TaxID=113566 RepID=A0ABQ4A7C7_9ACTN|nr:hypothetical protein [Actinoplanes humidus]GIE26528.1 hypothetical protein Ahu01nite_096300 [Actinoplanes humidus]